MCRARRPRRMQHDAASRRSAANAAVVDSLASFFIRFYTLQIVFVRMENGFSQIGPWNRGIHSDFDRTFLLR